MVLDRSFVRSRNWPLCISSTLKRLKRCCVIPNCYPPPRGFDDHTWGLLQEFDLNSSTLIAQYAYGGIEPEYSRAFAWNHCYTFFCSKWGKLKRARVGASLYLQASAELSAYLASFGMYGHSTGLMTVNKTVFVPVLRALVRHDLNQYKPDKFEPEVVKELIGSVRQELQGLNNKALSHRPIVVSDTLVSKILHGTLACVPAFDSHFRAGIRTFNRIPSSCTGFASSGALPTTLNEHFDSLYTWAYRSDVQLEVTAPRPI